ncbi:MAG: hypothetical protein WAS36_03065 [Candidatus Saccharimonadales bacterium]
MTRKQLLTTAVLLLGAVLTYTSFVWLKENNFTVFGLSAYQYFPLFGLLAYMTMWVQYMVEALMHGTDTPHNIDSFFKRTSLFVLLCIVLHPAIFISKLYADGAGLPPASYSQYVAESMVWLVGLGTVSLLLFIAFEFRKYFIKLGIWKYIVLLNDVAMLAIFYHGLRLGSTIQSGLFTYVWYFVGATLVAAIAYKYYYWHSQKQSVI